MKSESFGSEISTQPWAAQLFSFDPPKIPDEVIAKIERATGMRPQTLDLDWMIVEFHFCAGGVSRPSAADIRKKLEKIQRMLQTLRYELRGLPYDVTQQIAVRKSIDDYFDLKNSPPVLDSKATSNIVDEILEPFLVECLRLEVALDCAHKTFRRERGAPPKNETHDPYRAFYSFAELLVIAIESGGGRASVNPNTGGSGTLIEALDTLLPYLPAGAIPDFLSEKDDNSKGLSRLARVARNVRKRAPAPSEMDKK